MNQKRKLSMYFFSRNAGEFFTFKQETGHLVETNEAA